MRIPFTVIKIKLILLSLAIILSGCAEDRAFKKRQAQAKVDLGKSLLAEGNLTAGLNELLKAAELDPNNPETQNELALGYRAMEIYGQAITHFKKAVELRPDFSGAYNNLGTVYLILGEWDRAINCFRNALRNSVYATPHFAHNNLGFAYYKKGEFTKSVENYLKATQVQPSFSRAFHNLGITYEAMNELDKAIKAYKKSIRYAPEDPRSHFNLGKLYIKIKKPSLAIKKFEETIKLDKRNTLAPEAKRMLGKIK